MKMKETLLDCGEIRPQKSNLCAALRRETNLKCLILTLLLAGCIAASVVWCSRTTRITNVDFSSFPIATTRVVSPCDDGFAYIPAAFIITLYFVYLVECWHSKAREMLSLPKIDVNTVYRKVDQMRRAKPKIFWKAICYHYVRRNQFTRYRNGDSFTTSKVCYERVNSHAATSLFSFFMCGQKDISRDLVDLERHAVTKVRFKKGFIFLNTATATEFQDQRAIFFQEQEEWDDYMEMREGLELTNVSFQDLICWASPENLPWFGRIRVFWLCSFFLLSWPLRIILELNTAHVHYQVTKLFGTNYVSPQDNNNGGGGGNNYPFFPESPYTTTTTNNNNNSNNIRATDIQPHQWWRRAIWLSHLVHPFKHHHLQRRGGGSGVGDGGGSSPLLGLCDQQLESSSSSTSSSHDQRRRQDNGPATTTATVVDGESESLLANIDHHHQFNPDLLPLLPNRRQKFSGIWNQQHLHHLGFGFGSGGVGGGGYGDTINELHEDGEQDFVKNGGGGGWSMWPQNFVRPNFPRSVTLLMTQPDHSHDFLLLDDNSSECRQPATLAHHHHGHGGQCDSGGIGVGARRHSDCIGGGDHNQLLHHQHQSGQGDGRSGRRGNWNNDMNNSSSNLVPTYSQALLLINGSANDDNNRIREQRRNSIISPDDGRTFEQEASATMMRQTGQRQGQRGGENGGNCENGGGNGPRQNDGDNYGLSNTLSSGATTTIILPSSFHHQEEEEEPEQNRNHHHHHHLSHNLENCMLPPRSHPADAEAEADVGGDEPFLQHFLERLGPQPTTNSCNEARSEGGGGRGGGGRGGGRRDGINRMPTSATSHSLSTFTSSAFTLPTQPQSQSQSQSAVLLRSFTVSNFQSIALPPSSCNTTISNSATRSSSSDSFRALSAAMPRSVTGVEIDLTHPVSASVPHDPLLIESRSSPPAQSSLVTMTTTTTTRPTPPPPSLPYHHQHQPPEIESPPNYIEALRTSRPVSLPPWTRLRRCFTLNSFSSSSATTNPYAAVAQHKHYKCKRPVWLQDVRPTFLLNNTNNHSNSNSNSNVGSGSGGGSSNGGHHHHRPHNLIHKSTFPDPVQL